MPAKDMKLDIKEIVETANTSIPAEISRYEKWRKDFELKIKEIVETDNMPHPADDYSDQFFIRDYARELIILYEKWRNENVNGGPVLPIDLEVNSNSFHAECPGALGVLTPKFAGSTANYGGAPFSSRCLGDVHTACQFMVLYDVMSLLHMSVKRSSDIKVYSDKPSFPKLNPAVKRVFLSWEEGYRIKVAP